MNQASPERVRPSPGGAAPRVLIAPWPQPGHILPTVRVARELRRRGYRVAYLAFPFVTAFIEDLGFEAIDLFRCAGIDAVPADLVAGLSALDPALVTTPWLARALDARAYACAFVDVLFPAFNLALRAAGVPVVAFSTTFPDDYDPACPPLTSPELPRGGVLSACANELRWARAIAAPHVRRALGRWYHFDILDVRTVARARARLPAPRPTVTYRATHTPHVAGHEVVLCSAALDFPRRHREGRCYAGPCLDLEREVGEAEPRDGSRRMILVAFGSQTQLYPDLPGLLVRLATIARRRPEYHFVVAAGVHLEKVQHLAADNFEVHGHVPQPRLLRRASLLITHCGLGSVKEALGTETPILGFPRVNDQPGVSARVVYHGVGDRFLGLDVDVTSLERKIDAIVASTSIRDNVARMRAAFDRDAQRETAADVVEAAAGARAGRDGAPPW
jgi:zeaxanthin glucosyltransferase